MIPESIERYIQAHTSKEDEILADNNKETHEKTDAPRMLSGHVQGKFLEMISRMIRPSKILEIGTFTGYSAIAMAKGLKSDGQLYTIEVNPDMRSFIDAYVKKANLSSMISLLIGDALEIIPAMEEQFDLVFIDADKQQYVDYYEAVLPKLKPGGYIVADNVLWSGKVLNTDELADKDTKGIQAFNSHVLNDNRVEQVILSVRDGLLLIRKLEF